MLGKLKKIFSSENEEVQKDEDESTKDLVFASTALLLEIARSDKEVDDAEMTTICDAVVNATNLKVADVREFIDEVNESVDESISLYDFTSEVNEKFSREKKCELVQLLWKVAYADGRVDKYEEHYIRKISDLLNLTHGDFIKAKIDAR